MWAQHLTSYFTWEEKSVIAFEFVNLKKITGKENNNMVKN